MIDYRLPNLDDRGTEVTEHIVHPSVMGLSTVPQTVAMRPGPRGFYGDHDAGRACRVDVVYLEAAAEEIRRLPRDEIVTRFIRWTR